MRTHHLLWIAPWAASLAHAAPTFTGDVAADFTSESTLVLPDPQGIDVGIPLAFPPGTISGWDVEDIRLDYDGLTDTLYVGIRTYGIAGDADGDGDPDASSPTLVGLGGVDEPLLGGTESFALIADLDEDNVLDVIIGVPAGDDLSGFVTAAFSGTPVAPGVSFGAPLDASVQGSLFGAPTAAAPHLEFSIPNWSTLPTSSGAPAELDFSMGVFLGSLSDAGIGEDFFPGVFQFTPVDLSTCGDGIVDPGEFCDDGNTLDLDGCSAACDVEDGFVCECAGGDLLGFDVTGASALLGGTSATFQGVFECPEGEAMVGLTGLFIDNCPGAIVSMEPICATASVDIASGDVVLSPQGAVPGPGPAAPVIELPHATYTLSCPADQVVVGLEGKSGIVNPFNPIRSLGISELDLVCADPQVIDGSVDLLSPTALGESVAEGNPLPGDSSGSCAPGEIATGVGAWGTALIDGARLVCSTPQTGCGSLPSECRELDTCGDGIVEGPEACDDGNLVNDDGCTNKCTLPTCGDGITQAGEACDDANLVDDDGCTNACTLPTCGDGIVQAGEECDDANLVEDDGCTNACTVPTCGDGIVQPGESCDDGNTDDGDGCSSTCVEECGLTVDKTCAPIFEPNTQDCDGKVTAMRLEYTGEGCGATTNFQLGRFSCTGGASGQEPVEVIVSNGGSSIWGQDPSLSIGDTVYATAAQGGSNDFDSDTYVTIPGIEELVIHTSCSKPLGVGDQFGSFRLVELSSTDGGTVTLPSPPVQTDDCTVASASGPACTSRPTALTLRYDGGSCAATTNTQGGSVSCSGDAGTTEPVRVVVRKDAGEVYADQSGVHLGDLIEADNGGSDLSSNSEVLIYSEASGHLLQSLEVHTSCSKPLDLGDRFGAVTLVALDPKDEPPVQLGGTIRFEYAISNSASYDLGDVVVLDDVLGTVPGSPVPVLGAGESIVLSTESWVIQTTTNTVFVEGSTPLGATCSASDAVTVTVTP